MRIELLALIGLGIGAGFVLLAVVAMSIPKRLKSRYFVTEWRQLQSFCKDKGRWPEAIGSADMLLDRALKKRKFKGGSMGERMVSAQRTFSDNDAAWFAHNLHKKVKADPAFKLKESDVKDALVGFRQALKDIGALPYGESRDA